MINEIVRTELQHLGHVLSLLINQFGGGKDFASWQLPNNADAIASSCAQKLDLPKTWSLVDKVGYFPEAQRVAVLMGSLPTLKAGCEIAIQKVRAGMPDQQEIWKLGQFAHLLEWHRRLALGLEIDPSEFRYK